MKMVQDSLVLLPGGEQFANDRLQVMLPYNKDDKELILVGTFNRGFYLFDGKSFEPFKCEADSFIRQNTLYKGNILQDGSYAFSTLDGGMIVMDKDGKIKLLLNRKRGLSSNSVTGLFVDSKGLIWFSPEGSVSIVEYPSPITIFDESMGQIASVLSIIRFKGVLYYATTNGVFYVDSKTSTIKQVTGFAPGNQQSFHLVSVKDQLLVAHGTGLYQINGTTVKLIKGAAGTGFVPQFISQSLQDSNRIYIGLFNGLAVLYLNKNKEWIYEGRIDVGDYVVSIVCEKPGVLWLGTNSSGILLLDFNDKPKNNPEIKKFSVEQGLPPGGALVFKTTRKIFFVFTDGIYYYKEKEQKFIKDSLFNRQGIIDYSNTSIQEDTDNNLWVSFGNDVTFYRSQADGSFKAEKTFTARLSKDVIPSIYPEANGIVWFGGTNLYRLDQNSNKNYKEQFSTYVRRVSIGEDSVLFGGLSGIGTKIIPEIDYSNNSINFEFSAISMEDPSASEYQSILVGFDEKSSVWKKDTYRNYTNLPSGDYTFKVKGKNLYQFESKEASFSFTILPPWYRAWWAYACYALILGLGIFAVDRLQRRRLTRKEREKARIREMELRTETAEAEAKALLAENDRNKNVELLSEMGKEITASLDLDTIFYKLYVHVNQLADATIFGVGIYHPEKELIEYRLALENGKRYPPYTRNTKDKNQFPVWCIVNRKPVFINDVTTEYKNYIQYYKEPERVLEDGTLSKEPYSLIYLPLVSQERVLGVITIQSYQKGAYSDHHLNILQNLASYSAIAIDNADAYKKLNSALDDLTATQEKLIVQEKLASLGQLTAGIAHEIKNPLNFVNNFAQLAKELVVEVHEEFNKVKNKFTPEFTENFEDLLSNIEQNVSKTNEHGKRADSIVRSMLQHSRGKAGDRLLSDINSMIEEDLNLAYHGIRARDSSFNITIEKDFDKSIEKLFIVPQDVSRVFLNIINNGFYEANKKKKSQANNFIPTLRVKTINQKDKVEIKIRDNGNGIPPDIRNKLFNPFFTTKPAGEGTGLGLSLSYDIIVKQHGGEIKFESEPGEYTEFIITLPKNEK